MWRKWQRSLAFRIVPGMIFLLLLAPFFSACAPSTPSGSISKAKPLPTVTSISQATPLPSTITPLATHLQGPTNFLLNNTLAFSQASGVSMVNGNTLQLSSDTIKNNVIHTFQHTLFVVASNNTVSVYTDGASSPLAANTTTNGDGSVTITYTSSSKAGSASFHGTLMGNQMLATYTTNFAGGTTVDGQTFSSGSTTTSTFTTAVRWISPDQIPTPPANGHFQLTSDGGIALTWTGHATSYDIYRFVLTDSRGFQFVTKTASTSYIDESQVARSNAQTVTGIVYTVYAVGPTGVEHPSCVTISVSSLVSLPAGYIS